MDLFLITIYIIPPLTQWLSTKSDSAPSPNIFVTLGGGGEGEFWVLLASSG